MGGFAAATYKRGIRFINVPHTPCGSRCGSRRQDRHQFRRSLKRWCFCPCRRSNHINLLFSTLPAEENAIGICRNAETWSAVIRK
ncbi:hypothetical protein E7747_16240 (plasmid) [Duncaniella dubosii]|uniref:Uncharacterized protein n=1 Tax=Duncaniella dubosii TaxID=2518971 RepID=A0A4P7W842_9BACT|nr:hypothetical protein E7747_16240 [Duncaniella dubosii]